MDKNEIEIRLKDGTWIEVDRKENDRVCIMNKTGDGEILTEKIWEENELILELLGKYGWFRLYQEEKMKHLTFFDEIVKKCGYKAAWEVEEEAEKRTVNRRRRRDKVRGIQRENGRNGTGNKSKSGRFDKTMRTCQI